MTPWYIVYYVLAGWILWTLAEYLVHRFVLHNREGRFWPEHKRHHQRPLEDVGVPYSHAIGYGIGAMCLGWGFLDVEGLALAIGGFAGYGIYVTLHEGLHRWKLERDTPLGWLKRVHDIHHTGVNANFGVTTPAWDMVFNTYRAPRG